MQLSNLRRLPAWYFIFGAPEKSSLAQQFANQHKLVHLHLKNVDQTSFRDHINTGLVVQCTPSIFRQVESLKHNIFAIILEGQLSVEELSIKSDYQKIGKCINLKTANYKQLRKQVYPKLIILFGPNKAQIIYLCQNYFNLSGYTVVGQTLKANDLLSRLPKQQNYILTGFQPNLSQLNILQQFFNVQVIHLKHERTELSGHQEFFNLESKIIPAISNKSYYHCINGSITPVDIGAQIGQHILPQLIFVNAHDENQRRGVNQYIQKSGGLLLNMNEIQAIFRKQHKPINIGIQRLQDLVSIIFKSSNSKQIFLIDYPQSPEQFFILKDKTRPITLFADCLKPSNYQYSRGLTPAIYFLQTHTRKHIQLDFQFEKQIIKSTKYIIVTGPPCVGKTSASKYISSSFGYKHIEYELYIASVKQKLIAPQDGEELPFHKIIKHFNSLITSSGDSPILIDGLNLDWKDIDNWFALNGPPIFFNLKTDQKELIRRTRRKNEADVNAEVTEEQAQKAKELIAKNSDWADQLSTRSPASTLYQIDFSPQLIKAQKLLDQILKPRVFLVQQNYSFLFQNIALKYNLGYFDLKRTSLREVAAKIRQESYRNIILNNYSQLHNHLVCQDFHQIEKLIGSIRYLAIWNPETIEGHDEKLHLQAPPNVQKPKAAEGEEGGEAPPAEQEGQAKKKVFNVYDYSWTKPGNQKNISQWLFNLKKNINRSYSHIDECFQKFQQVIKSLSENKDLTIYDSIVE